MLSKKVEYGLMALLHTDDMAAGELVSSKDLAEHYGLPVDLMGKVLQSLARSGLLEAIHGARGGYRAGRALSSVTLGEVIEAIEGPVHLVKCQHDEENCGQFAACTLKEPFQVLRGQLQEFLFSVPLNQFKKHEKTEVMAGG